MSDYNAGIIEEFRANGGKVGGGFEGRPLLLLHTLGARSGEPRVNPAMYLQDGDRYFVFASMAGAEKHPAWYHNLRAHPDATIEVGTDEIPVHATEILGDERDRWYDEQSRRFPQFADYQANTDRVIPVLALDPR